MREQCVGKLYVTDLAAFRLDINNAPRIERCKRSEQLAFEVFLRRLLRAGHIPQERAAVTRDALEIEHLRALGGQCSQQTRFAAAGQTADKAEAQLLRTRDQRRNDVPTIGAI